MMEAVKLSKPWLEYDTGDTVKVDPLRAEWLRANGYSDSEVIPGPFPGIEILPPAVNPELPAPPVDAEFKGRFDKAARGPRSASKIQILPENEGD